MPFRNINLLLLAQGQLVTNIGSQVYDIAMLLWIKELTGSAGIMGLAMLLTSLPEALLAPFGGRLADRFGRLRTIIASDLVSAAAIAMVAIAVFSEADPTVAISLLCVGNLILGMSAACFGPAVTALIPALVPQERLERGNALFQFGRIGGRILGQGLGGLLFGLLGMGATMLINAASYLASAVSESWIRVPDRPRKGPSRSPEPLVAGTLQMLQRVWHDRPMRNLLLLIAAFHLCLSCLPILLPFHAEHVLQISDGWFGLLMAAYTAGIMLGFSVAGMLGPTENRFRRISFTAGFVGMLFAALAVTSVPAGAVLLLLGIGSGIGIIIVNLMTELQLTAPEEELGGIMGAAQAIGGSSLPIGMALTGLLNDSLMRTGISQSSSVRAIFLLAASIAVAAAVAALAGNWRAKAR